LGHYDTESRLWGHYYFISDVSNHHIYPDSISSSNKLIASEDVIGSGDLGKSPELRRSGTPASEQVTEGWYQTCCTTDNGKLL